ncbi:MAG TPA: glycine zipper 2TM domain-containing protein [Rhizobacter sp.]|nr:glycine zipper 2TM domain-containing protein [Rhizobacter sp.]
MTVFSTSAELAAASAPGAVSSTPRRTAWWVASGLGLLGAGALAAALVTQPAPDAAAPLKTATKAAGVKPSNRATEVRAAACAECGTVESVKAETQKGEATGLGAVAGGVLGGVVGHQMGEGNGKKAMTVIGAVGGGLAGHEVEKRARSVTAYQVRVSMDDGSTRTVTQSTAPAVGARVEINGQHLKPLAAKS